MSNYYGVTRTNYFKVTDEDKFKEIINRCVASGDCEGISIFERLAEDNTKFYDFGCYGDLEGFEDKNDDYDFDAFTNELWESLDSENKVSLFVRYINLKDKSTKTKIININE